MFLSQNALDSDEQKNVAMGPERDRNSNYGLGSFTVNSSVIQQTVTRRLKWYIQGTKEEEEKYEEYGEYKHGDIQFFKPIHHERLRGRYDSTTKQWVTADCERSIVLGQIVSGEGKGTIVTVEAFEGRNAPEVRMSVPEQVLSS
ncbi:hypothetical protein PM082_006335 [Marasmius tenuissimus]|nr:hypothetical protein PM082_006335 [Marasmius tenuissimus]